VGQIQEIDQRDHEHPNQIHEVPVETRNFEVIGLIAAALIFERYGDESDHASGYVKQVEAGDTEK
jgi:hypothetical protein